MADFNGISQGKMGFFNLPSDEDKGYPRFSSFEHRDNYIKQTLLGSKEVLDRIKAAFSKMQQETPVQSAISHSRHHELNHDLERDKVRFEVLMKAATDLFEEQQKEFQTPMVANQPGSTMGVELSSLGPTVDDNSGRRKSENDRQVELPQLQDGAVHAGWPQSLDLGPVDSKLEGNDNKMKSTNIDSLEQSNVGAQTQFIKVPLTSAQNRSQNDGPKANVVSSQVIPRGELSRLQTSNSVPNSNKLRERNSSNPILSTSTSTIIIQPNEVSSETPFSEDGLIDLDLQKLVEVTFVGDRTPTFIPRRGDLILVNPDKGMSPTCKQGFIAAYEGGDTHRFEHGELVVRVGKFDEVETGIFLHKPFDSLELYMYHRDGDWTYLGSQLKRLKTEILNNSTEKSPGKHLQVGSPVILSCQPGPCGSVLTPRRGDVIVLHPAWMEHFPHRENFRRSMVKWHRGRQVRWAQNDMLIRLFVDRDANLDERIYSESEPISVPAPGDHSTCRAHGSCKKTHRPKVSGYAELYRSEGSGTGTSEVTEAGWVFWGRTKLLFDTPFVQKPPLDWIRYVYDDGTNSDEEADKLDFV